MIDYPVAGRYFKIATALLRRYIACLEYGYKQSAARHGRLYLHYIMGRIYREAGAETADAVRQASRLAVWADVKVKDVEKYRRW